MLEVFAGCDMAEDFRRRISGMFFNARACRGSDPFSQCMNLDNQDKKTYTQQSFGILWAFIHETKRFNSVVFQFIINLHGCFRRRLTLWVNIRKSLVPY